MKCEDKNREEKITLYMDRQLDWKEEKEFLKHIKTCPECKHALQQAQQLRQMLLDIPMEPLPEGLHENIMKSIEKEMKKSPAKKEFAWQKYGALAACFLILALAGKQFYQKTDQGTEQGTPQVASMPFDETAKPVEMKMMEIEESVEATEVIEEARSYPTIIQSRNVTAPETAKALPATPNLAAGNEEQQKEGDSKTTEDVEITENTEKIQAKEEEENTESEEKIEEDANKGEDVLSQPVPEGDRKSVV